MDPDKQYELSRLNEKPSSADHPTPLLPLLYVRHYWRTTARRCRDWLGAYLGLDYVAEYPRQSDDATVLLMGPTTPGKSLLDVAPEVDPNRVDGLEPESGVSRLRARYELHRATATIRQRVEALQARVRGAGRAVDDAVRGRFFGGDGE